MERSGALQSKRLTDDTPLSGFNHAGRCMASREKSFTVSNGKITYNTTVSGYRYEYDANNNLSKLSCTLAGSSWSTVYTYDGDNRPLTTTLENGKIITNTYDAIGRLTRKRLGLTTNYDTTLSYLSGVNGSQTALLATYKNGSDSAYNYAYDANGNITSISQGTATTTYAYDSANQLIRENNSTLSQTWTYSYDSCGNLLNKKRYAYTTGTLGSCLQTVNYTYGNSAWGDQLTSCNGQSITYDAMGNPTSYLGATMTWQGKQLATASKNGNNYGYFYDENGLRLRKTTNGVATNYYYNGSVFIGMTQGTTCQRYNYDSSGNVVSVNYNGTEYYYLRNGQGDIVKLIDNSGSTVVEYKYDSWGKQLSCTGSLSTTLGTNQPFRYRGYVYDAETGWYYLQSRYYNPEVGRFISADVYLSTGQGVLGHNAYAYCNNNPINRSDPSGCRSIVPPAQGVDASSIQELISACKGDPEITKLILDALRLSSNETLQLLIRAISFIGKGKEYALGNGGYDCSSYVQEVFLPFVHDFPGGSIKQLDYVKGRYEYKYNARKMEHGTADRWQLEPGDLLFFKSPCFHANSSNCGRSMGIHHVGI